MRLLVITSENRWTDAVRALFSSGDDVITWDPRQLPDNRAVARLVDACFVAAAETGAPLVETVKQVNAATDAPIFALTDAARPEWEEAALLAGAQQVFKFPLRASMIQLALSRMQRRPTESRPPMPLPPPRPAVTVPAAVESGEVLALLRDFSRLLVHAVDGPLFMGEYLRKLREVLRCGRLVLYLPEISPREKIYRCAFASGIDQRQFEAIRLTANDGVGHVLLTRGAVVLRHRLRHEVAAEAAALHELDVFGAELAVPLSARDGLVGMLLVGPRIAGADYSETELTLLYHLMEELGAGIRNAELHAHLFRERGMFSAVLRAVPVGCAVLSASLQIVHANRAFRAQLGIAESSPLRFEDLPQAWASVAYAVVQGRVPSASVEVDHEVAGAVRKLRITVRPLEAEGHADRSVFLALEDITAEIRARQEVEHTSVHNLLQRAGEQLSNEFRNALTPVDIMVQLLRDPTAGRNELERLGSQLSMAMHRLHRRIDDLAYLTRSAIIPEMSTISAVLKETRERLDNWLEPKQCGQISWTNDFPEAALMVDRRAIALALAELVMNAVEAADGRQVLVSTEDGADAVSFRVRNSGIWAPPPESSGFRHRPFISNKSTGVGLGVEVASRVAEHHGGRLILGPVSSDAVEAILRVPREVSVFSKL